ncbi:MAG: S8 family serine peptidase [Bacteroidetes bacterium]|nr:S8 family serine peptidase [Bacteroidota bacterium]
MYVQRSILLLFLFILLLNSQPVIAQESSQKYWVYLTDKNLTNKSQIHLSDRSLERRSNQGIPLRDNDHSVSSDYIRLIRMHGVKVVNVSRWFNAVSVVVENDTQLQALRGLRFVDRVAPVKVYRYVNQDKENSVTSSAKVALTDYGSAFNQVDMISVDELHALGFSGKGMIIGVMDAGFDNADSLSVFDSLFSSGRVLGTWDFVSANDSVFDDDKHGTHVLSLMAANKPGELVGTAPDASYWLFRTEDVGSELVIEEDNWVAAAEFADSVGVDVLNTSLGYTDFDSADVDKNHTYADMDGNTTIITRAADMAASKGMLVVNSAGNSGSKPWFYVEAPADGDSVLAVGAVNSSGNIVSFSSRGPSFDGRVKPNVCAQGQGTFVANNIEGVFPGSGTSFSSPLIAGAAACLWQAFPQLNNMDIFDAIQKSAHLYNTPDNSYGFGIPNFLLAYNLLMNKTTSLTDNDSVLLWPNPFTDQFRVFLPMDTNQTATINVYNVLGQSIYSETQDNSFEIYKKTALFYFNKSGLAPGLYIIELETGGNRYVLKAVRQ